MTLQWIQKPRLKYANTLKNIKMRPSVSERELKRWLGSRDTVTCR